MSTSSIFNGEWLSRRNSYEQARDGYLIASAARDAAIDGKIRNILSHIENGNADKAMKVYNQLLEEMAKQERFAALKNGEDDTQLKAAARNLIESKAHQDLSELIKENTSTRFENGFSYDLDNYNESQESLLENMCDLETSNIRAGIKGVAGGLCKTALCALAGAGIAALVGPAAITGAAIGGAIGLASAILL